MPITMPLPITSSMPAHVKKHIEEDLESVNSNVDDSEVAHDHEGSELGGSTTDDKSSSSSSAKMQLAKKETAAVFRLRLLVFLVLFLAAVAVSVIIYYTTASGEHTEYEAQFDGAAKKIQEAFWGIVQTRLPAVSSLAVAVAAHSQDHATQKWPFVTVSSFQQRAATARAQSGILYVHINPEVLPNEREDWSYFAAESPDASWIDEGIEYQDKINMSFIHETPAPRRHYGRHTAPWPIWYYDGHNEVFEDDTLGPVFPTWQTSPVIYDGLECNENILANKDGLNAGANLTFTTNSMSISQLILAPPGDAFSNTPSTAFFALMMSAKQGSMVEYKGDPIGKIYFPVFNSFDEKRKPVAIMLAGIHWADYFEDILPSSMSGIEIVLDDSCGGTFTYQISGETVIPLGEGDLHDRHFDDMMQMADFSQIENIADGTGLGLPFNRDFCPISLFIYPSQDFYNDYNTTAPIVMTAIVAFVFLFTSIMFLCYDRIVERRQALVMLKAQQTTAIVSSLFPANVRDRLMEQATASPNNKGGKDGAFMAPNSRLKGFLDGGKDNDDIDATPIADLFPHCTVLFADIAGFTAWSSTRDPAQVFILLQTVYQAFDKIAKRRRVFKVETIGDSYVAVTGLPEPQPTHAVIMARFAAECRLKMNELTSRLENTLGPDTGDLTMRFGLHSGPVTAGVLRGERARFQLFGDTVNTASRMESTGIRDRIQVSESTYQLLVECGKIAWLKPRSDPVQAKGKGLLKTFWVDPRARGGSSTTGSSVSGEPFEVAHSVPPKGLNGPTPRVTGSKQLKKSVEAAMKQDRLVNWIVDMLQEHIRKLVAMRKPKSKNYKGIYAPAPNQTSLDEVAEVIYLPRFCEKTFTEAQKLGHVKISEDVMLQLKEYVATIADSYRDNPFHNFEHACHVSMAVNKLLKRIVSPDIAFQQQDKMGDMASKLHNYTHGINSDPLTILGIVVSALIHDADHRGISNTQLAVEDKELGEKYNNKSIAEQHSLDLGWELLMQPKFEVLRGCLFTTEEELKRFRQVLVNVVLATDIFDKELNDLRKKRWGRAFCSEALSDDENNDLRATIVIEHIIQASDVSHTMQHWHIYRKWNKRLFQEMYLAYNEGRMGKDPSTFWYKGELGFFDNYIIPLAKKLKDCNVFGVSSDECLNYAMQNRNEWADKGAQIVDEMMQDLQLVKEKMSIPEVAASVISTSFETDDDENRKDGEDC